MNNIKLVFTQKETITTEIYADIKGSDIKRTIARTCRNFRNFVGIEDRIFIKKLLESKVIHEGSESLLENCVYMPEFINALNKIIIFDYSSKFTTICEWGEYKDDNNDERIEYIKDIGKKGVKKLYPFWKDVLFKNDEESIKKILTLFTEVCDKHPIISTLYAICNSYRCDITCDDGEYILKYQFYTTSDETDPFEIEMHFGKLFTRSDDGKLIVNEDTLRDIKILATGNMVIPSVLMEFLYAEFESKMYKAMEGMGKGDKVIKLTERFTNEELFKKVSFFENMDEYMDNIIDSATTYNYKEKVNEERTGRSGLDPNEREKRKERFEHNQDELGILFESRLEVALAGFKRKDVSVYTEYGKLIIKGEKEEKKEPETYAHRGLAQRSFTRTWTLSDDTKVEDVKFEDGMLTIKLAKVVPDHHAKKDYL